MRGRNPPAPHHHPSVQILRRAMQCLHAISTRPEGYAHVMAWWLRMEKYKMTTHQALFRLDILNLIVDKLAPKERTKEYVASRCLRQ